MSDPLDMTSRRSNYAREMIGLIQDCSCDGEGVDMDCLRLSVAARWPEPHPWQGVDDIDDE